MSNKIKTIDNIVEYFNENVKSTKFDWIDCKILEEVDNSVVIDYSAGLLSRNERMITVSSICDNAKTAIAIHYLVKHKKKAVVHLYKSKFSREFKEFLSGLVKFSDIKLEYVNDKPLHKIK